MDKLRKYKNIIKKKEKTLKNLADSLRSDKIIYKFSAKTLKLQLLNNLTNQQITSVDMPPTLISNLNKVKEGFKKL